MSHRGPRRTPAEHPTDVRPLSASVDFRDVELDPPFVISGRAITHITVARVQVEVVDRGGARATGTGTSVLSVPWSWPGNAAEFAHRDGVMRALVREFAGQALRSGFGDPFETWQPLYRGLEGTLGRVDAGAPLLAGLLALGAVDNALHDAWSRVAGLPMYAMYTREHMQRDLTWAGAPGVHPGDFIGEPRALIPVQHVVGVSDPLCHAETGDGPRSLEQWLAVEEVGHLKLKLAGDPGEDARRISEVFRITSDRGVRPRLAVDPNEAYPDVAAVREMLALVEQQDGEALDAIDYLEQPFPRDVVPDGAALRRLANEIPVLMDEGYGRLRQLVEFPATGWSGVVVKASKGQSHAMVTYAIARSRGLRVMLQDLTATDSALAQAAGMAAALQFSWPSFEYNSRQFAPQANEALRARNEALVAVDRGHIAVRPGHIGLYPS